MRAWFAVAIAALGCARASQERISADDARPENAESPKSPKSPPGWISGYKCTATGDYVQAEVLAAVKGEDAAWLACAQPIVQPQPDQVIQVIYGSFSFSWQLVAGKVEGEHLTTMGGDGNPCVRSILARLRSTAAFATPTNGTLSCQVSYDTRRN